MDDIERPELGGSYRVRDGRLVREDEQEPEEQNDVENDEWPSS